MISEFHERLIDRHFAAYISGIDGKRDELFTLLLSMASSAPGSGHVCLDLEDIADRKINADGKVIQLPDLDTVRKILLSHPSIAVPGEFRPLVLDSGNRLYLYRYWRYEHDLACAILAKGANGIFHGKQEIPSEALDRLFADSFNGEENRQKTAAVTALTRPFCVITGGPGTGKTSTVVRVLALLLEQKKGMNLRIAMAAPTGKAAARLKASVNAMRSDLDCPESVKDAIPGSVVTLHRLLGGRSGKGAFRHGIINPLPFDMVIVDEASMIALPLMNALFSALQPEARLLLLGDRDQLASVEAGAVLGDICSAGEADPDSSLGRSVVVLEKNYRFSKESGIGELSQAVNAGRGREAMNLLESTESSALFWQEISTRRELTKLLGERVISRYSSYFESTSPADALERFERFRILAALRDGPFGVIGLNFEIERMLRRSNLLSSSEVDYRCRPLLVTANDYTLQLFNGDTGILFPDVSHGGALRAFFYSSDGGIRSIAPVRLPRHETAFAMTVHKSQGSEFERVVLVLPNIDSEILSRELLYTAITRAKKGVEIWGGRQIFGSAVKRKIKRCSGLADALLHADDEQ